MGEQQIYFHILPGDETQLHPEPGISAPLRQKAIFRVALTLFNRLEFKSWKFNFCSLNLTLRAIQVSRLCFSGFIPHGFELHHAA